MPEPGTDRSSVNVPEIFCPSICAKTESSETRLSISLIVTLIDKLSSKINVLSLYEVKSSFITIVGGSLTDITFTLTFNVVLSYDPVCPSGVAITVIENVSIP